MSAHVQCLPFAASEPSKALLYLYMIFDVPTYKGLTTIQIYIVFKQIQMHLSITPSHCLGKIYSSNDICIKELMLPRNRNTGRETDAVSD